MSSEETKQRESNETSMMLIAIAIIWLTISLFIMTSSNKYYEQYEYANGEMDPNIYYTCPEFDSN